MATKTVVRWSSGILRETDNVAGVSYGLSWAALRSGAGDTGTFGIGIATLLGGIGGPTSSKLSFAAAGYVNCVPGDLGKTVFDDGGNTNSSLQAYNNTTMEWIVTAFSAYPSPGSVITLYTGTGTGTSVANPNYWTALGRFGLSFKLAQEITPGVTITAVTIRSTSGTKSSGYDFSWAPSFNVFEMTPITDGLFVTADYELSHWGSVALSTAITFGNWVVGTNEFVLNAAGIALVQAEANSAVVSMDTYPATNVTATTAYMQGEIILAGGFVNFGVREVTYDQPNTEPSFEESKSSYIGMPAGGLTLLVTYTDNTSALTKRGFCCNTTGSPTVADTKVEETGNFEGSTSGEWFANTLTGLLPATLYYARSYVYNSLTSTYTYGDEVTFTTLGVIFPSVATTRVTSLIHRYDARKGIYQLEISLGGVTSIYSIPGDATVRRATAEKQQEQDKEPIVTEAVTKASEIAKLLLKGAMGFPTQPQQSISDKITALFPPIKYPTVKGVTPSKLPATTSNLQFWIDYFKNKK